MFYGTGRLVGVLTFQWKTELWVDIPLIGSIRHCISWRTLEMEQKSISSLRYGVRISASRIPYTACTEVAHLDINYWIHSGCTDHDLKAFGASMVAHS